MKIELCWGTDLHLDVLDGDEAVRAWMKAAFSAPSEAVLLTGDTSTAPLLIKHLRMIREFHDKNVYFVLGNHDFWDGSLKKMRTDVVDPALKRDGIVWMGSVDYVPLGNSYAIVGHDGWYDALYGNHEGSRFVMNDWFQIDEFREGDLIQICRSLASDAAKHVESASEKAVAEGRSKIIVMTHFPPFVEACFHRGRQTEQFVLPWYSSRLMGDALSRLAEKHPEVSFTVLCGHTHSAANVLIKPNLRVVVGESRYGTPRVSTVGIEE